MTNYHGVNHYVVGGEERSSHIHSLIRLGKNADGYRYECLVCRAQLKNKSGVMVDDLKARLKSKTGS